MKIEKHQVEHIAKLARIKISEKEKELYASQLTSILDYIEELNKVNTQDVEPTHHVLAMINASRKDEALPSPKKEKILAQAPERKGDFWKVRKVM